MSSASSIRAGRAFVEIFAKDSTGAVLQTVAQKMRSFGDVMQAQGQAIADVGQSILRPIMDAAAGFAQAGSQINAAMKRTGLTAAQYQELAFAARQSSTDIEAVEQALAKMQKAIGSQSPTARLTDSFKTLGLSLDELKRQSTVEQFRSIASGLAQIEDPAAKAAAAMQIFGRGGTDMLPMLERGGEGLRAFADEAQKLGIVMSQDQVSAAAKMDDAYNKLNQQLMGMKSQIGAAIAPELLKATEILSSHAKVVGEWLSKHEMVADIAAKVGAGITAIGLAYMTLGKALKVAAAGAMAVGKIWGIIRIIAAAGAAAAGSPVVIATGVALAGAGAVSALRSEMSANEKRKKGYMWDPSARDYVTPEQYVKKYDQYGFRRIQPPDFSVALRESARQQQAAQGPAGALAAAAAGGVAASMGGAAKLPAPGASKAETNAERFLKISEEQRTLLQKIEANTRPISEGLEGL